DSRLAPQKIDLEFIEWLGENNIPFSIVFTKVDKLKSGKLHSNMEMFFQKLMEQWEELPPYFASSSESRLGREEILNGITSINEGRMML
ncbi:hypothetical protein EZS27_024964, partial [termite gut metagenome]